MAKIVTLVDDFDHETPATETIQFVIDGTAYSMDLCDDNAKRFRDQMQEWTDVATRLGRHKVTPTPLPRKGRPTTAAVSSGKEWYKFDYDDDPQVRQLKKRYRDAARAWAVQNGYSVGARGVLPATVYADYEQWLRSHGKQTGPESVGL